MSLPPLPCSSSFASASPSNATVPPRSTISLIVPCCFFLFGLCFSLVLLVALFNQQQKFNLRESPGANNDTMVLEQSAEATKSLRCRKAKACEARIVPTYALSRSTNWFTAYFVPRTLSGHGPPTPSPRPTVPGPTEEYRTVRVTPWCCSCGFFLRHRRPCSCGSCVWASVVPRVVLSGLASVSQKPSCFRREVFPWLPLFPGRTPFIHLFDRHVSADVDQWGRMAMPMPMLLLLLSSSLLLLLMPMVAMMIMVVLVVDLVCSGQDRQ